ncbi:ATP-binding protein [Variovorax sp. J22G21]|uniref:ATP-binding response regulator n=1 Tax=Variovorax fucosicus TaxID=3053517 RepID=UPI00257721B8|nr:MULTISPECIES: hybrid sensor histidine kinase/response regulator [unclassified Variovorax]MDM0037620.1 ATP-binding protein [Variovorax sp. J22R193]MDM0062396.1 ATP-binding protein [Variovorax sp. J22G21]
MRPESPSSPEQPARAPGFIASRPTFSDLQFQQLEQMIRSTPWSWILAAVGGLLCYLEYEDEADGPRVLAWLVAYGSLIAMRLGIWLAWALRPGLRANLPGMVLPIMASNQILALFWGALSVLLHDEGPAQAEAILHIAMVTVALGGAVRLSTMGRAAIVYVVLILGPLVLRDIWFGGSYHLAMALIVSLIGIYTLLSAKELSSALHEIQAQRKHNAELVIALSAENERSSSARRTAEEAVAARMRFFASANHDLRQPLNAMALLAQTVHTVSTERHVKEMSEQLVACADGMTDVVDDLLDITRADAGSLSPQWSTFAIDELLGHCCRPHQAVAIAKGLRFEIAAGHVVVRSDRALLARVVTNLLANAIRYTREGQVRISSRIDSGQLRLAIEDTGIGISSDHLPRVFEEFYQVDNPARDRRLGYGLGLSTVKRLSELLDLRVTAHSVQGQGSVFELHLPLADAAMSEPPEDVERPAASSSATALAVRILVVDDDPSSLQALDGLLASWGMDVRSASDVEGALGMLHAGFRPHALVVDLRLGPQVSGIQAIEDLRSALNEADLPALIVTGDVGGDHLMAARAAGLPVIIKPVRPPQLRAFLGHAQAHIGKAFPNDATSVTSR